VVTEDGKSDKRDKSESDKKYRQSVIFLPVKNYDDSYGKSYIQEY